MAQIRYATQADDAEDVPADQRCSWPSCTRRRAAGRASGSGRRKEYCEKADRPEKGGGPEHNARNRWTLRERGQREKDASNGAPSGDGGRPAGEDGGLSEAQPLTLAKLHAGELLEQARRQHVAALDALAAERELYSRLTEQLHVLADPAALDLEIASVTLKAGREVSQAAEDAARARHARLTAERERDAAIRARNEAEQALATRTAELDEERDRLVREALDAAVRADSAREQAAQATAEAERARQEAGTARRAADQGRRAAEKAKADAAEQIATASARADAAAVRADEAVRAAGERARAERDRADAERARADEQARHADRAARESAEQIAAVQAEARALHAELSAVRSQAASAIERADGEAARLRADIVRSESEAARSREEAARLQEEAGRERAQRDRDITRLEAAHREAVEAERARARRAEGELDALRSQWGGHP
jgi:hypothetical protein